MTSPNTFRRDRLAVKKLFRLAFLCALGHLMTNHAISSSPTELERTIASGELYTAQKMIAAGLKEDPNAFALLFHAGQIHLTLEEYKQGIRYLKHASKVQPDNYRPLYYIGLAQLKIRALDLAEESLSQALQLEPNDPALQELYFLALIQNPSPSADPQQVLKNYPLRIEFPETYIIHAAWHFSQGQLQQAEYFLSAIADIVPHKKMLWHQGWLSDAGWIAQPRPTGH